MERWRQTIHYTSSGRAIRPYDLRSEDVCIRDIAASLARLCRFVGAVKAPNGIYSVAQHCVMGAQALLAQGKRDAAAAFLMHDGHEGYFGDFSRVVKQHPAFALLEPEFDRAQQTINVAVGLPPAAHHGRDVELMDDCMGWTELRDLKGLTEADIPIPLAESVPPLAQRIVPWSVSGAETLFLMHAHVLLGLD